MRFTPTRVGTTQLNWTRTLLITVHPHPRGDDTGKTLHYGVLTRKSPSKSSIDRAVSPQVLIWNPCSELLEWIITHPPSFDCPQACSQSRSRTIAETLPTKTPAFGSRYHRVNSPRNPRGTRSRIMMTITHIYTLNSGRKRHEQSSTGDVGLGKCQIVWLAA